MGLVKKIERKSKNGLMRFGGLFLRASRLSVDELRAMSFRTILVVRQHNQMGDMMLAIPALRALKETYPGARVGVVTSTLNRDVLDNNPYVEDVFMYDKRNPLSHLRLLKTIRRKRYDLAIALHTVSFSFTTLMLAVLSRAAIRIGSTSRIVGDSLSGSYLNLTLPLPSEAELASMNEAEHNLFPLRAVGITTENLAPHIVPSEASEAWAESFAADAWREETVRLALHPGAGKAENIWPAERFASVVNAINKIKPVSLVVVEGPRDRDAVARFTGACEVAGSVVRGRRISDVAALLRRADLAVCNDTGVMHVSAAAGARTLAVFGPTNPARWAPRCENLHIVRSDDGSLSSITEESVVARVVEELGLVLPAKGYL